MKKLPVVFLLFMYVSQVSAQDQAIEKEIRGLEKMEVAAILSKDSLTLLKLWDKDYTVNSPDNVIYSAGETTLDRPVLKRPRTTFTRDTEKIMIQGNTVVSMGSETVVPAEGQPQSGQTIKRRYTNIWMKQDNQWKLVARHANIICQTNSK
jgi:hypothetical protein